MSNTNIPYGPFSSAIRAYQVYKPEFIQALVAEANTIDGWLCNAQIPLLWHLVGQLKGKFVEVGAWKGRTTLTILSGSDSYRLSLDVVDPFMGSEEHKDVLKGGSTFQEFENNLRRYKVLHRVTVHKLASVDAAKLYQDGSLAGVFIDAAHDYENVKADILAWTPKIEKGGVILFHDYPNPKPDGCHDPETGFADLFRAVNEFVRDNNEFEHFGYVAGLAGAYKK